MAIKNVLVVDDSKTELMFLSDLLQKRGFTARTAENAEQAMQALAESKPDLILMDVVMPAKTVFNLPALLCEILITQILQLLFAPVKIKKPIASGACAKVPATTLPNRSIQPNYLQK